MLTVLLGVAYPLLVWVVGTTAFAGQSAGSPLVVAGQSQGSRLIGQQFDGPGWFQPRPSANDYDAQASGGTNLGPNSPDLLEQVQRRRSSIAAREEVPPERVPADAVTASGSGLDAYISPEYAALQVARVARERGLTTDAVDRAVAEHTEGRTFGFLGMPRVNVVELDLALTALR